MHRSKASSDVFRAIADPTRRAILDRLRAGPANAGALAGDFRTSRPGISKHLRVLREARLIVDRRIGRERVASVEIAAPLERVFEALTSKEITDWWGLPGVFDAREWTGDVRNGGRWRASGVVRGQSYTLEGEFLEVRPPTKLVHTWQRVDIAGPPTIVTYYLEPIVGGTRLTIHHTGFVPPEACLSTCQGWEASLQQLASALSGTMPAASGISGPATPQARAVSYFEAL